MEFASRESFGGKTNLMDLESRDPDPEMTRARLDALLQANAAVELAHTQRVSRQDQLLAETMTSPLPVQKTFAYFGLLLGTFPPATLFLRYAVDSQLFSSDELWLIPLLAIVNMTSAIVGYFTGKYVGTIVGKLENSTWPAMILLLPFVGLLWGIAAGGAGGFIIFIIGAVFGAAVGGAVGAAALPLFVVTHRLLKRDEMIEMKHFLPLAFGITLTICSFILGL